MTVSQTIALTAVAVLAAVWTGVSWQAREHVTDIGFWVDDSVTFEVRDLEQRGAPLNVDERIRIVAIARRELEAAFAGLRVRVSADREAFCRVRVVQLLTWYRTAVSGQSNAFGPLGGGGAVSFE